MTSVTAASPLALQLKVIYTNLYTVSMNPQFEIPAVIFISITLRPRSLLFALPELQKVMNADDLNYASVNIGWFASSLQGRTVDIPVRHKN